MNTHRILASALLAGGVAVAGLGGGLPGFPVRAGDQGEGAGDGELAGAGATAFGCRHC